MALHDLRRMIELDDLDVVYIEIDTNNKITLISEHITRMNTEQAKELCGALLDALDELST